MNTHAMSGGARHRRLPALVAAAAALLMVTTVVGAAPAAASNHFRPLEAWNNWHSEVQGNTDGLFVRWSEPISPNPPAPPSGYTIHTASDCSGAAISTGAVNHWAPGRPAIRDLTMTNWSQIQTGQTYYLRVAPGSEQSSATGALNVLECIEFVAEVQGSIRGWVTDDSTGQRLGTATVSAFDADGNLAGQQAVVSSSPNAAQIGNYHIVGLEFGTYTVVAEAPGYQSESQVINVTSPLIDGVVFRLQPEGTTTTTTTTTTTVPTTTTTVPTTTTTVPTTTTTVPTTTTTVPTTTTTVPTTTTTVPPTGIECGHIVTEDITLTEDLGPCTNNGLIVQASGTEADPLVVDLGGHTIFGVTGTPGDGAGVLIDGQEHVVVRNGTIRDFDGGVAVDGGGNNHLEDLIIEDNIGSPATDWGEGIAFGNPVANNASNTNTVCNSIIRNNGPYGGVAVYGTGTTGNVIGDPACGAGSLPGVNEAGVGGNLIIGNDTQFTANVNQNDGVRLEPFTNSTTVQNNVVEGSGLDGVAIFSRSTDNVVRGNIVRDNGAHDKLHRFGSGVIAFAGSARNVIEGNTVTGNAANGIVLRGPTGPQPGSMDNQVLDNTAVGNAAMQHEDPGAPFFDLHDANFDPPCDNNTWLGNIYGTFNQPCVTAEGLQVPALVGQVTDAATEAPISGATVTAVHSDGTETTTTTDADGDYAFQALEPGQYTVTVDADGYESASDTATVEEDEVTELDFALQEPPPPDPANRQDCMNGGWEDYGFRNQGQCIRFVNTGKDDRT